MIDDATLATLTKTPLFRDALLDLLPALQADDALWDQVHRALPGERQRLMDPWRHRRLLAIPKSVEEFRALALAEARAIEPTFPDLDLAALQVTARWYAGWVREADTRVDGVGWTLRLVEEDCGPAESVHEEDWVAVAYGPGLRLHVERTTRIGQHERCFVERLPPAS